LPTEREFRDMELLREIAKIRLPDIASQIIEADISQDQILGLAHLDTSLDIAELRISTLELAKNADAIADGMLHEANILLNAGKVKEAFGRLVNGFQSLFRSLVDHHLSLETITDRIAPTRDIVSRAAKELNAHEFTIEISITFPPSLSIALHFIADE